MLKSYIVIAIRNLLRSKLYTLITIVGLAIGYTATILILLFVSDEFSYDRSFDQSERLYRLVNIQDEGGERIRSAMFPVAALPLIVDRLSDDIQAYCRIIVGADITIRYKDKAFFEQEYLYADDTFFELFSLPFLTGDPTTALSKPNSIVITESIAHKYFGDESPMGRVFTEQDGGQYTVTGVIRDLPKNMHFSFDFLASLITVFPTDDSMLTQYHYWTYLLLKPGVDIDKIRTQLPSIAREYYEPVICTQLKTSYDEYVRSGNMRSFELQPLNEIHLDDSVLSPIHETGNKKYITILATIGAVVLIMSAIIFINLSVARSAKRSREVGMRKVFGATRANLMRQFLTESVLLSFLALLLAFAVAEVVLPSFCEIAGKCLMLSMLHRPVFLLTFLGLSIIIGVLAGMYPSFYLSSFQPINSLKRQNPRISHRYRLIDVLVVFQLTVSLSVLILMFVVRHQLEFVQHKNLGFNKEQTLVFQNSFPFSKIAKPLKEDILNLDTVRGVSFNSFIPGYSRDSMTIRNFDLPKSKLHAVQRLLADEDFIPVYGIQLLSGEIIPHIPTKEKSEIPIVINETAITALSLDNPLNTRFLTFSGQVLRVSGVIRDIHSDSLFQKIRPLVLITYSPDVFPQMSVKVAPENLKKTIDQLKAIWHRYEPDMPFNYFFFDKHFEWLYHYEKRIGNLLMISSFLTIFLACLGLFGQIAYRAEQQAKELAIRKILGASPINLILQILKSNVPLFTISLFLSWPLSWLLVTVWLDRFAYHYNVDYTPFGVATAIILVGTVLTMLQRALKSAMKQPVEAIMYE